MIGRLIGAFVAGGVGILVALMGWLIWKKQMISLLHDYHTSRVSSEDKPAFCRTAGIGLTVIGAGLLPTAVLFGVTGSVLSFLCFAVCFVAGIAILVSAERRYNR